MATLPTGTVTLVFTDIEGSTRLLQILGPRYRDALEHHRAVLREAFSSHGGVEVDTQGDAFFMAFPTPQGALKAAVTAQRALASHTWHQGAELLVRMGIHTGTPDVTNEGYVGADVHLGARICAAAWGGQILVSTTTASLVSSDLSDVTLRSLGAHALKDIDERVELSQVITKGLREDFPPPRTSGSHPTNLPSRLPPLIGRDHDIATITELLQRDDVSLVTLVGPGGTGKTRLALATGAELLSFFPDGVFFTDLSATTDASLVVAHIAQSLSLRETPGRSLTDTLTDHLAHRETLLILDNLEQVIDAAPHISSLLTGAPGLKVVATSREALRIAGERVISLDPLGLPGPEQHSPEDVGRSPAVALFTERAQAVKADFSLTEDNAADVAHICRRLDGLPLAIELAAARTNVLSPSLLLSRLDRSLKVLGGGRRDAAERQRTLTAAIAWSYDLLSQDEQILFRRLGVFAGGWSLEAAEEVCHRGDLDTDVLDGLASLVDRSLVRTDKHRDRLTMLETIREFALERLEESGEAEEIRRAHAGFFRTVAEEAEPHLIGGDQKRWFGRIELDHDNIRAALGWALELWPETAARIANALWRFWDMRGHVTEGRRWLVRLLQKANLSHFDRMRATEAAALLAEVQDDYATSISHGQEALSIARELGDTQHAARALIGLGSVALRQGDLERASSAIEEAVALSETASDPHLVVRALNNLAIIRSDQQRTSEALSLYERSAEIAERSGDRRGVMMALLNGGELAAFARKIDEARDALQRVLLLADEFDDPFYEAAALLNIGIVDVLEGHVEDAVSAFYRSLQGAEKIGSTYLIVSCLDGLAAAVGEKDPVTSARLFAASDAVRARGGLARSPGEQALYQTRIDALEGLLTREAKGEVSRGANDLPDVITFARQLVDKAVGQERGRSVKEMGEVKMPVARDGK